MQSNIYEYLSDKFEYMSHILSLCGADKKYIGKNASDFEKFRELCRTLVSFSGSSLYRDINLCVSELFGESVDITQSDAESLWKRFYGDCESVEITQPDLVIKMIDMDAFANFVDISEASNFVRPDRYHASLARERAHNGQDVCESEKNLLIMQELRETAEQCVKTVQPLVILADCSAEIIYQALRYLSDCNLLPNTLILTNISGITVQIARLLEFENISLCAAVTSCDESFTSSMRSIAQTLPVGGVMWALKGENFAVFCSATHELLEEWRANNTAPKECVLKFEKISNFIRLNY